MKRLALVLPALLLFAAPAAAAGPASEKLGAAQLRTELRRLWEEHVTQRFDS
jgi:hypothetical protein